MTQKKFTITFLSIFFLIFGGKIVFAQGASDSAFVQSPTTPSVQTNFPFTINGVDCNTRAECKILCDDPVNVVACATLNPEPTPKVDRFADPAFVQAATAELGCSTAQTCKAMCSLAANFDKCSQFATEQSLPGGYDRRVVELSKESTQNSGENASNQDIQLLQEAQLRLVTSEQTLKEFCDVSSNQTVCSVIAKKLGLRGGLKLNGPGGCQSAQTCRAYCDDPANFAQCKQFQIAGLNGCTSELACYNELQSHPEDAKKLLVKNEEAEQSSSSSAQLDPEEIAQLAQTCSAVTQSYQGKTTSELASDLSRSGVCQAIPKSGVPGKNSNCDAYLSSNQPFDQATFEKICDVTPIVASGGLSTIDTQTAQSNLSSYQDWCQNLPSVGQSQTDWQVVPTLCQNFVSSYQQARTECAKPESERPAWLKDTVAYTRYCLSAPSDAADYAASCATSVDDCKQGGFDWYCQQAGKSCVPLYQGRPLDQSVETFASAGMVKDGSKVSLVLDESIQEFAKDALADSVAQTSTTAQFEVVNELPKTISRTAVFVSGTGVSSGARSFEPTVFGLKLRDIQQVAKISSTPTNQQTGNTQAFTQPWFLLSAHQAGEQPAVLPQSDAAHPDDSGHGWNLVKRNEQDLKQKYLELQTNTTEHAKRDSTLLLPNHELKIDPNFFRPQATVPRDSNAHEPERRLPRVSPIHTESESGQKKIEPVHPIENEHRVPTPVINTSGSSGGSTGSGGSGTQSPTNEPHVEPTKPPALPEPTTSTQTNTGATGSTTTNSGSGSSGSGSGGGDDSTTPEVKGAETQQDMVQLLWESLTHFFHLTG